MGRLNQNTSVALRRQTEAIQRARESLSVDKFLCVLSQVALNGTMPRYGKNGQLIEEDEPEVVDPKLRLQTTQYLVDKVMSNPAPQVMGATSEDVLDQTAVRTLSNEELRAIAASSLQEVLTRQRSLPGPVQGEGQP
jgi:hypothetical protein